MVHFYDNSKRIGITRLKFRFLLLAGAGLSLVMSGCAKKSDKTITLSNKPLAVYQNELLDIAFETATSIPVDPHIKDRSKTQAEVVMTCLKLNQPKRALGYIEKIDDWRRGDCYADLAFYCAKQDYKNAAPHYIELAEQIAEKISSQEWQKDRIRAKIAQTYTLLQQTGKADQLNRNLEKSETGKVEAVQAAVGDETSFGAQIETLDSLIAKGDFDIIKNALQAYAGLFDRFYDDAERRSTIEQKIRTSFEKQKLPIFILLELLTDLSKFSLEHNDQNKALELVNEAQLILDNRQWPPENHIQYQAGLVELRFHAGDVEKARTDANAALSLFNEKKDSILNIHRAGTLRRLAEAYISINDKETALSVYKQVIEEGIANPNSRPRAEDLSAICCSMALYAVEPDAELWTRIRQIREALGEPW